MSASAKVSGVLIYYRAARLALLYIFHQEVSGWEMPWMDKVLWLLGQDSLSSPLALVPLNKRPLLSMGQALSSACSVFPKPLEKFKGTFWGAVAEQLQICRDIWVIGKPTTSANP